VLVGCARGKLSGRRNLIGRTCNGVKSAPIQIPLLQRMLGLLSPGSMQFPSEFLMNSLWICQGIPNWVFERADRNSPFNVASEIGFLSILALGAGLVQSSLIAEIEPQMFALFSRGTLSQC